MNRCAIVIGVDRTGDLPPLTAAASGAADFGDWCATQKIQTTLLTDASGGKVRIKEIRDAVQFYVEKRSYAQIILFFAGHGILKSPDEEYWLLSDAPGDQYEAVNVIQSVSYARNTPFRHVVFISDACRAVPQSFRLTAVRGMGVFPNAGYMAARPKIDQLYATAPADPAYEAALNDALRVGGIFTKDLLNGLNGADPTVPEQSAGRWFVTTRGIDPYLVKQVPRSAAKINVALRQVPEVRGESNLPLYLSELSDWTPPSGHGGAEVPLPPGDTGPDRLSEQLSVLKERTEGRIRLGRVVGRRRPRPSSAADRILEATGREGFESRSGFSVVGAAVTGAWARPGVCDVFEEDGTQQVRVNPTDRTGWLEQAASVLLRFESGGGTVLAAWPGYVGTVLVEQNRVVNVNYTPARRTPEYAEYKARAHEIESRRALIAAAARTGSFRLNPQHAYQDAQYLRSVKRFDPTLGLYAAYAYAQQGAVDEIRSLLQFMRSDLGAVPFDVVVLARLQGSAPDAVPFCPMLTQGWAHLDPAQALGVPIQRAWDELIPSLWTTFTGDGVAALKALFEEGH